MQKITYDQLEESEQKLLDKAKSALETAYNPYSKFFVGSAFLSQEGQIITGSNVENAAYGSTICAERGAILRANAMGIRSFTKIAIIARGEDFKTTQVTSPCGSCRQMIFESAQISNFDIKIIMSNTKMDKIVVSTIKELLPLAFGPTDLGIDIKKYQ